MTRKSKEQSKMHAAATSQLRSPRHGGGSGSEMVFVGTPPAQRPPRVLDFEELDKKSIDALVDALKYIATTCGIMIAMYSQIMREYLKDPAIASRPSAQLLLFAPILLWFGAVAGTVLAIYPKQYIATTDLQKEVAVKMIRRKKRSWLRAILLLFLCGLLVFVYIIGAQIWPIPPFGAKLQIPA